MKISISFVAAVLAALFTPSATAAKESGNFTTIASLSRDSTALDHAGETITGGALEGTGTVLESTGGPFSEGEHSLVTCAS